MAPLPHLAFSVHPVVSRWHVAKLHFSSPPLNVGIFVQLLIEPNLAPSQSSPVFKKPFPQVPSTPRHCEVSS